MNNSGKSNGIEKAHNNFWLVAKYSYELLILEHPSHVKAPAKSLSKEERKTKQNNNNNNNNNKQGEQEEDSCSNLQKDFIKLWHHHKEATNSEEFPWSETEKCT